MKYFVSFSHRESQKHFLRAVEGGGHGEGRCCFPGCEGGGCHQHRIKEAAVNDPSSHGHTVTSTETTSGQGFFSVCCFFLFCLFHTAAFTHTVSCPTCKMICILQSDECSDQDHINECM